MHEPSPLAGIDQSLYVPSDWQQTYHCLDVDEALGAGAAGPGKSICLLMDPFQQVLIEHARCLRAPDLVASPGSWLYEAIARYPLKWGYSESVALHLRRVSTWLEETLSRAHRIFPQVDPDVDWNAKTQTFVFKSGYKFKFGSCKEKTDFGQYLSAQYTHIAFDELTQFLEEQYDQITSRLRSKDPIMKRILKVRAMSNPMQQTAEGVTQDDPYWVRRRFVDPAPGGKRIIKRPYLVDGKTRYRTSIYLPATIDDNPDKDFVESYKNQLSSKPEHIRQAMLHGNWYFVAGAHYSESFDPHLHIVKPFRIPQHYGRFRSMDWGYKSPGCIHWYAVDDDGNLIVEKELTFQLKTPVEVCVMIEDIERRMGLWRGKRSLISGPADNQLWEERGDVGPTKADTFEANGVSWVKADKRSRKANSERFEARLLDHANRTTQPGIVFFEGECPQAIKTIPGIPSKLDPKTKSLVPNDGGPDHWLDSILYGCAYADADPSLPQEKPSRDDDDDDDRKDPERGSRSWGYGYVA